MRDVLLRLFTVGVFALAVAACSSTDDADNDAIDERLAEKGYGQKAAVKSVSRARVTDFTRLDDHYVVVKLARAGHYLLKLDSCDKLGSAEKVGFMPNANDVGEGASLRLMTKSHDKHECTIKKIYKLEKGDRKRR